MPFFETNFVSSICEGSSRAPLGEVGFVHGHLIGGKKSCPRGTMGLKTCAPKRTSAGNDPPLRHPVHFALFDIEAGVESEIGRGTRVRQSRY